MLPTHDTLDVPEARTMIIFLGHLFARLKESSNQIRAAIKIQKMLRLQIFRNTRHYSAILIQRRVATYMQQRKYLVIIREWRAYKSCCDPCSLQRLECSFESDGFDWEEEMARELESEGRNPSVQASSDNAIPSCTDYDDERDSDVSSACLLQDSDRHLADSEILRFVEIEKIECENSSVDHGLGERAGADELSRDEDDFQFENNLRIDNPHFQSVNERNSYNDHGDSVLKEISIKLQYCTDLDEVESTEIISRFLQDQLPMIRVRKLSRGFRRLQVPYSL